MTNLDEIMQLRISDFRSISGTATIPLDAPFVLIHGPNGSGKTSILSALELALTGDIPAMRRDDSTFSKHLIHEGANQAKVTIIGTNPSRTNGSYIIKDGVLTGTPYLNPPDRKFFGERCYLAQSMLGRLLDIYQKSKVEDGESALTQFVKDLLGLNQLDALVDGLHDAGHKSRTRNLVPDYRSFEDRVDRSSLEMEQLTTELSQLDGNRGAEFNSLSEAFESLFPNEKATGVELADIGKRLHELDIDNKLQDASRRRSELFSISKAWSALPQDADAKERSQVEELEKIANARADEWRKTTGSQHEELIVSLRKSFPDLASWSSTDPASSHETASRRVDNELLRLESLIEKDVASDITERELNDQILKEEARDKVINSMIAGISRDAGEYASSLARLIPHVHTEDCPLCGRNFSEVSKEPLALHVQRTIAKLTEDAGKLSSLSAEKSSSAARLAQLRRDLNLIRSQRISQEAKIQATKLRADLSEGRIALDRLSAPSRLGTALLKEEADLKDRLASFRERDRTATDLRATLMRIAKELKQQITNNEKFEIILTLLQERVTGLLNHFESLLDQKNKALLSYQAIGQIDRRRQIIVADLGRVQETILVLRAAVGSLETIKSQAKLISDTARSSRTSIVRRVFNDSLNKLWRDLFIRLAPTEPFVPAFRVPESDSDDFATLETIHRSGKKAGTPGAMLSAGNLNTAALTLFLALHLSVGARLRWLVLDDPVQNMDEVHIAQFAALLRTLSREHGTKVIIAVHERSLFDYLKLELSPAFEKDRLLTLELRRVAGEDTIIDPKISTYEVDAVAA